MKYFAIQTDEDNIGRILHDGIAGDPLDSKSLYQKFQFNEIKDFILDDDFKKTDVLESNDLSLLGLVVSQKFYELIKEFNLQDIQFVNINTLKLKNYKLMFFNSDLTDKVDYDLSLFKLYKLNILKMEYEEIDFVVPKNRDAIIKIDVDVVSRSARKKIFPSNGYKFIDGFKIGNLDIFRIGHYDLNFYISEKVKEILEKNNVSGCKFVEQKMFAK